MAQRHDENYNEQPMTRMGRIQGPSRRYRRIRHPNFPAAEWADKNPLLQRGELGIEKDTHKMKAGDGVTYWNDLPYMYDDAGQPLSTADYQMGNASGGWTTMSQAQQDALNSGATTTNIGQIATNTNDITNINTTIGGYGDIVTHDVSEFATAAQGAKADTAVQPGDLATVATSGDYDNLLNKPTIPTVNDATLTIQKNGTTVNTFTANASSNVTANITVPTKISDLTNDSNFANIDLSNLTSTGANIGNWSSNVSNCITEMPQDIQLELNAGTLTLKAGSKVYIPNGAGVFTEVTIANDISRSAFGSDTGADRYIFPVFSGGTITSLSWGTPTNVSSGTTPPTSGTFYNESTNYINNYSGGSVADQRGFPIGIMTVSSGTPTSIDQVFNGIGYIGSHVFFTPGYSVLTPNGRNADGTLANQKYTFTSCTVYTRNLTGNNVPLWVRYNGTISFSTGIGYDPITNQSGGGGGYAQVATATLTGGVISNFVPKQPFRAVDYSDSEYIANCAMPSNKYINLTLPTSGGTISAAANGYLTVSKAATASGQYINFVNNTNGANVNSIATGAMNCRLLMPVSKGDVITVNYTLAGTTDVFRFIYANGSK